MGKYILDGAGEGRPVQGEGGVRAGVLVLRGLVVDAIFDRLHE